MAVPDIRKVKEITDTIQDKVESYFTGVRVSKKTVAKRIVNACAIKILQHELQKQNGTNTEHLVDDLCLTDKLATDRDFLIDIIDSAAQQIITATSTNNYQPTASNQQLSTNNHQPTTTNQQLSTNNHQPTTTNATIELEQPVHHQHA